MTETPNNRDEPPTPAHLAYATPEPVRKGLTPATLAAAAAVAWFLVFALVLSPRVAAVNEVTTVLLLLSVSLAAVVLGSVGLRQAGRDAAARRRAKGAIIAGGVQLLLLISAVLLVPTRGRAREPANRIKCASNLRQIGYAIQFYANEHGGTYPAGFDEMLTETDLTSDVLICPSGNDIRATGPTTAQVVQDLLNNPGRCSYVYVAAGLTSASVTPGHVLAYEPAKNHAGHTEPPGINVLYGDGTVRWTPQPQAGALLADLAAGQNPPRPATKPGQIP